MAPLHFRYPDPALPSLVAHRLRDSAPGAPHATDVGDGVLGIPWELWTRPLVPELAVGYGGRLTAIEPEGRDRREEGTPGYA